MCDDVGRPCPHDAEERWNLAWAERARLLRLARRRLPIREDAEDVVAEAVERAGRQSDLPLEALAPWLTRVTINLCVDRQRREVARRALVARPELLPGVQPGPEEDVARRDEAQWVSRKVAKLPARQAQALRLRAEGHDNQAIAARLGTTVNSVEGLLKRAREHVRAALSALGAGVGGLGGLALLRRPSGRGSAAILLAAAVVLTVLPWHSPGHAPGPPRAGAPSVLTPGEVGAPVQTVPPRGPGRYTARQRTATRGVDPRLGRADAYLGPRCLAAYCLPIVDDTAEQILGSRAPKGWSPADLHDYLGEPDWAPSAAARRPLVAIVSWHTFPWVVSDLEHYRRTFHLPPCGLEDGCLQLSTARGDGYPEQVATDPLLGAFYEVQGRNPGVGYNANPAVEQAQLLQGVSASCPECRLALVRAESQRVPHIVQALRDAASLQPSVVVTNLAITAAADGSSAALHEASLYGAVPVLAAGGAGGYTSEVYAPRSLSNVIAVGGTAVEGTAVVADPDNASFCNRTVVAPAWQARADTGCPGRAGMDLALPAGERTSLAVYASGGHPTSFGWYHLGHATQAVAVFGGQFARHELGRLVRGPGDLYAHPEWFADVVQGSTECRQGGACSDAATAPTGCRSGAPQVCRARRGWDGASGLGEPRYLPWP